MFVLSSCTSDNQLERKQRIHHHNLNISFHQHQSAASSHTSANVDHWMSSAVKLRINQSFNPINNIPYSNCMHLNIVQIQEQLNGIRRDKIITQYLAWALSCDTAVYPVTTHCVTVTASTATRSEVKPSFQTELTWSTTHSSFADTFSSYLVATLASCFITATRLHIEHHCDIAREFTASDWVTYCAAYTRISKAVCHTCIARASLNKRWAIWTLTSHQVTVIQSIWTATSCNNIIYIPVFNTVVLSTNYAWDLPNIWKQILNFSCPKLLKVSNN